MLFACLELTVVSMSSRVQQLGARIEQVAQSSLKNGAKASDSGKQAKLSQASFIYFKDRFFCMILLKTVLSLLFMCQFCYSLELAQRNFIDQGRVFDNQAKLCSQTMIFGAMNFSAVLLLL